MSAGSPLDTLRYELLNDELKALHALESWGASLFLTAIALLAKQLVDWSVAAQAAQPWQIYLLPGCVGTVAFVFLRTVNFRIRRLRARQYALLGDAGYRRWGSFGGVGWLLALMPLAFGIAASRYFAIASPAMLPAWRWLSAAALLIVVVAAVMFIWQTNRPLETYSDQPNPAPQPNGPAAR